MTGLYFEEDENNIKKDKLPKEKLYKRRKNNLQFYEKKTASAHHKSR